MDSGQKQEVGGPKLTPVECWETIIYMSPKSLVMFHCIAQFSLSVMSDPLKPNEPQQARPPCPSPTPGIHPNPCPLSQWCHPTTSSYVIPFSSCPQSFPAPGSCITGLHLKTRNSKISLAQEFGFNDPCPISVWFSLLCSSSYPFISSQLQLL